MTNRPNVVLFDVLETLIDLDPMAARLEEVARESLHTETKYTLSERDAPVFRSGFIRWSQRRCWL